MRQDPTLSPPRPARDFDFERKSKLEEGDRRSSNARLARSILSEFWVEGTAEQKREALVAELVSNGPFSVIEAGDALDEIEREDHARLDDVQLRARARGASKRTYELIRACSSISHPVEAADPLEAADVAWGVRQVTALVRELQADAEAIASLYEAARARKAQS